MIIGINFEVLLIILLSLVAICTSLFLSVICIYLIQAHKREKTNHYIKIIKPVLHKLFTTETVDFFRNHTHAVSKLQEQLKGKLPLQTLEDLLLGTLEDANCETKVRARTIAGYFGFPKKCLSMITDRLTANIAIGCRKAGLYQYEDAIPDILTALDITSSDTQYEALMALSRIGDVPSMVQALNKINHFIFVNERAINEILNTFTGNKSELYKKMIYNESEYLVSLVLKAIDREIVNLLLNDIITIIKKGGKELRLAGIIAIGKSGNDEAIDTLIKAMNDKEWEIRAMAAKNLGVITRPDAVTALAKAARDREWWVRQNAVTAILAYPDRHQILASIVRTGDRYAYDSMLYSLERANEISLLSEVKSLLPESGATPEHPKSMSRASALPKTKISGSDKGIALSIG
ncbi:MAG: HEAT repeat domain-containing protein [Treponema sp.]|nr:HEAT repeat domain-containing protein [Treponema sp.]